MISLVITSECNQRCEYCFSSNIIKKKEHMTLDQLETIYKFLDKSNNEFFKTDFALIGGEPTIHPHFLEFTKSVTKRNSGYNRIFSNGTNLCKYVKDIPQNFTFLINVNSPEKVGFENYKNTLSSIEELMIHHRVFTVGCNLFPGQLDYNFIWSIVDKFRLPIVRVSVASPSGKYSSYQSRRDEYFNIMHNIFINFCKDSIKHMCKIGIDCNRIPFCYFNDEERHLIEYVMKDEIYYYDKRICQPHLEIYPDYSINSCLIFSKEIEKKTIFDFNTPEEAYQYLQLQTEKLYRGTAYGRCANCIKHKNYECQGGCLHFQK